MNINDYGHVPKIDDLPGIPARVTAVHKERYQIVCEHGMTHARLKTREYYVDTQDFPTTGDFVMVNYIDNGDSQIIATLPRKTFFSRREPGPVPRDQAVDKAEMLRRKNEWHKGLAKFTRQRNKEIW